MTFMRYALIQVLAYCIDMGVFFMLLKSSTSSPIVSNIVAKLVAGLFAFFIHRHFTFDAVQKSGLGHQAARYFMLLALNIPVASGLLGALLLLHPNEVATKFVADVICVALTYWVSKYFIFRRDTVRPGADRSAGLET